MVVNPCVLETPLETAECLDKAMGKAFRYPAHCCIKDFATVTAITNSQLLELLVLVRIFHLPDVV